MTVHSISNKHISISVNSFGAELTSLKASGTELLWQSDKAVWPRYAPILFPIVGKLKDDQFKYNRSFYKMSQHGFARDKEFVLTEKSERVLEFELTANEESLAVYPFHFSLRIRYELEGASLRTKYIIFNPDKNDLLFSIGAHPGFNCKRMNSETLNDFYLEFDGRKELVVEKLTGGLQSGETSTIQLASGRLALSTELFNNDALVCKNTQIEKVLLGSSKSKEKIVFTCKDWPYFGIWAKKGSDAFVCLEPWYGIADSVKASGNFPEKEGIIQLAPHDTFAKEFLISVVS